MSEIEHDETLDDVSKQLHFLSRQVSVDQWHKNRLREELLRRHQELTAGSTQRAAVKLWPRFARLKRLTLVAPPALAAAMALSIGLWALQISGQQSPQAAEAARITNALTRSVPTVTSWRVTLKQHRSNATFSYQFATRLITSAQRLYIWNQQGNQQAYLYSYGHWREVTAGQLGTLTPADFPWAFAVLPARLENHEFQILPDRTIGGRALEGIRFTLSGQNGAQVTLTEWVDHQSGLVMELDRNVTQNGKQIEGDVATYQYQRTS